MKLVNSPWHFIYLLLFIFSYFLYLHIFNNFVGNFVIYLWPFNKKAETTNVELLEMSGTRIRFCIRIIFVAGKEHQICNLWAGQHLGAELKNRLHYQELNTTSIWNTTWFYWHIYVWSSEIETQKLKTSKNEIFPIFCESKIPRRYSKITKFLKVFSFKVWSQENPVIFYLVSFSSWSVT